MEGNLPAAAVDAAVAFSPLVVTKDGRNAVAQLVKSFNPKLNKKP